MWKFLLLFLPFTVGNPDVVNMYRAKHGAVPVTQTAAITESAQAFAETLANAGTLYHSGPGENLAMFMGGHTVSDEEYIKRAIGLWYDEIQHYDFDAPGFSPSTGHFTQLVWNSTTQIGTGIASKNDKTVVVMHYKPPGNMLGKFAENVFPPVPPKPTIIEPVPLEPVPPPPKPTIIEPVPLKPAPPPPKPTIIEPVSLEPAPPPSKPTIIEPLPLEPLQPAPPPPKPTIIEPLQPAPPKPTTTPPKPTTTPSPPESFEVLQPDNNVPTSSPSLGANITKPILFYVSISVVLFSLFLQ